MRKTPASGASYSHTNLYSAMQAAAPVGDVFRPTHRFFMLTVFLIIHNRHAKRVPSIFIW
jgi:hypothetical protein